MDIYLPQTKHVEPKQVRDIWAALSLLAFIASVAILCAVIAS